MKAAVWHAREDVRIQNVADPGEPRPGEVQVKVAWCGICGTDLHEYLGGPLYIPFGNPHPVTGVQAPVIIGHEMSGTVTALGVGVTGFAVGDRVAACPIIGCGHCRWCHSDSMAQCDRVAFLGTSWTGGALAESLNLNAYQCYHLPDSISDEIGALVEPFSSTVRAVAQGQPGAGRQRRDRRRGPDRPDGADGGAIARRKARGGGGDGRAAHRGGQTVRRRSCDQPAARRSGKARARAYRRPGLRSSDGMRGTSGVRADGWQADAHARTAGDHGRVRKARGDRSDRSGVPREDHLRKHERLRALRRNDPHHERPALSRRPADHGSDRTG